jgi:hypothetical protein
MGASGGIMWSSKSAEPLLLGIGATLILSQTAEQMLKLVLELALPGVDKVSIESMLREQQTTAKFTLGQLIGRLKQRAGLNENFDDLLKRFLEHRNTLAHDFSSVPGFDTNTEEGIKAGEVFIAQLGGEAQSVMQILANLMYEWHLQLDPKAHVPNEVLRAIGQYRGSANSIFFDKEEKLNSR